MTRIEKMFKTHPMQGEMGAAMVTDCQETCNSCAEVYRDCEQSCHKMMGAIPVAA